MPGAPSGGLLQRSTPRRPVIVAAQQRGAGQGAAGAGRARRRSRSPARSRAGWARITWARLLSEKGSSPKMLSAPGDAAAPLTRIASAGWFGGAATDWTGVPRRAGGGPLLPPMTTAPRETITLVGLRGTA